jgi:flagellar hook assembly protein FlgD
VVGYYLPAVGEASLRIYTVSGRLVRRLDPGRRNEGWHEAVWDGRDTRGRRAASGVYFLRIEMAGQSLSKQVTLLR